MIRYVTGDATQPEGTDERVIIHVANDARAWGAGFVMALSRRWPQPEQTYRAATELKLGAVQLVEVEPGIVVANMVAQHGFPSSKRPCALDYDALTECLITVAEYCSDRMASVHAPRIGCGIAGGDWAKVELLLIGTFCALDVPVTVYDLPTQGRAS